jgi:phosphate/sulfate permease
MLGTTHWITPTDAVPLLCTVMRSLLVVIGSNVIWLKVLIAVGSPLGSLTLTHAVPFQSSSIQCACPTGHRPHRSARMVVSAPARLAP